MIYFRQRLKSEELYQNFFSVSVQDSRRPAASCVQRCRPVGRGLGGFTRRLWARRQRRSEAESSSRPGIDTECAANCHVGVRYSKSIVSQHHWSLYMYIHAYVHGLNSMDVVQDPSRRFARRHHPDSGTAPDHPHCVSRLRRLPVCLGLHPGELGQPY